MYKVNIIEEERNNIVLELINILESNKDEIYSSFPVNDTFDGFSDVSLTRFKKDMGFNEDVTFDEVIDYYINRYGLENYSKKDAIRIINLRYEASLRGYSLFNGITICKDISDKSIAMIEENQSELLGVDIKTTSKRYYPESYLSSHTVGYVSSINTEEYSLLKNEGYSFTDDIGKTGIELTFEKYIKGQDGEKKVEVDSLGNVSNFEIITRPKSGMNVTLTLNYRLQKVAYDSLVETIDNINKGEYKNQSDASSGAVVVVDVRSGEILSSVSYPSFDSNDFVGGIDSSLWKEIINNDLNPMYNRIISGTYAPGSIYKMLVGIAALETEIITKNEVITDKGVFPYGHYPTCWIYEMYKLTHGDVNMVDAIKHSCNYYFYEVGRRMGIEPVVEYSKMFGLGSTTGVEIKGEKTGSVAGDTNGDWYLGDTLSAVIGQSYNAYTPLQIVNYISAIANGGYLNSLTYVKDISYNEDEYITNEEIENTALLVTGNSNDRVKIDISDEVLEVIKEGMFEVTKEGGTSYNVFKDFEIDVAGKTGTAQLGNGQNNGIFAGFAPYDNPEIAIVAVIETGESGVYAADVVKPIMAEYFKISNELEENDIKENVSEKDIEF